MVNGFLMSASFGIYCANCEMTLGTLSAIQVSKHTANALNQSCLFPATQLSVGVLPWGGVLDEQLSPEDVCSMRVIQITVKWNC